MSPSIAFSKAISPRREMISYETIWRIFGGSLAKTSEALAQRSGLPSEVLHEIVEAELFDDTASVQEDVASYLASRSGFSVCVRGMFQYPERIRAAAHPVDLFYYRGDITLHERPALSIVGTRTATEEGLRRARKLAWLTVKEGLTVVSGLARGIDTAAMETAIASGGTTIGVIGTPILEAYPKENRPLQEQIASDFLLVSHVPFYHYAHEPFQAKRRYFPERNALMSALSAATIIVEASEASGTLTQARAALSQGRKLFILNSCFENRAITWPARFEQLGAIRVREFDEIFEHIPRGSRRDDVAED